MHAYAGIWYWRCSMFIMVSSVLHQSVMLSWATSLLCLEHEQYSESQVTVIRTILIKYSKLLVCTAPLDVAKKTRFDCSCRKFRGKSPNTRMCVSQTSFPCVPDTWWVPYNGSLAYLRRLHALVSAYSYRYVLLVCLVVRTPFSSIRWRRYHILSLEARPKESYVWNTYCYYILKGKYRSTVQLQCESRTYNISWLSETCSEHSFSAEIKQIELILDTRDFVRESTVLWTAWICENLTIYRGLPTYVQHAHSFMTS